MECQATSTCDLCDGLDPLLRNHAAAAPIVRVFYGYQGGNRIMRIVRIDRARDIRRIEHSVVSAQLPELNAAERRTRAALVPHTVRAHRDQDLVAGFGLNGDS